LAVLKAGGAYVPLDPDYPQDRLSFMIEDSQVAVILTQEELAARLPPSDAHIICLDTQSVESELPEAESNPVNLVALENLAYVIYTSGSTGNPKGALITHRNVTRLFEATAPWFHYGQDDVWTMFHSYSFDFSVWEMWGALLHGGRLVIVPYWVSRSPEKFYGLLQRERVTILNQTPSAFKQLVRAEQSSTTPSGLVLRLVIFGGEALDFQSLRPWFERHGDRHPQLINMYGITETTVHVTYRPVTAADSLGVSGSLVGVPILDLELYVLDQNQNPVPIGVPGELYVGGAGLGRGYLNRPDLTAERFVPNPFSQESGERLYRSGDLVRYLSNREIEYLGRIDDQVKIRGFRIELGEIESALRQHPAVREAVVVAREEAVEEPHAAENPKSRTRTEPSRSIQNLKSAKELAAYVVPAQQAPTVSELNAFLKRKLPEYMAPSHFIFLDALPLTSNGKLDRRRLPATDHKRPKLRESFVAPRTPVEELLARIWAEVLHVERIGIHDNFFELGGHSLLLTQVASRIQNAFQETLPLRVLFDAPTIAELTGAIAAAQLERVDTTEAARMIEELKRLSPAELKEALQAESRRLTPENE
jgi:amino acid adenylation domain-containing protein